MWNATARDGGASRGLAAGVALLAAGEGLVLGAGLLAGGAGSLAEVGDFFTSGYRQPPPPVAIRSKIFLGRPVKGVATGGACQRSGVSAMADVMAGGRGARCGGGGRRGGVLPELRPRPPQSRALPAGIVASRPIVPQFRIFQPLWPRRRVEQPVRAALV